jgi:pimeloyl-ACP methyl ester carboxylesterase
MNTIEAWPEVQNPPPKNAVVFVHGIFSSHETAFIEFYNALRRDLPNSRYYYFDYKWGDALEDNGDRLGKQLEEKFKGDNRTVTLICHSMGGLVARLAILSRQLDCVKTVFLLGTPNLGAVSTAQLGVMTQFLRLSCAVVAGTFIKKQGVTDLTNAYAILQKYRHQRLRARGIDYVSIPGCYFHAERSLFANYSVTEIAKDIFSTVDFIATVLSVGGKLTAISFERPHDGIVEERSNKLLPTGAGRGSEIAVGFTVPNQPGYRHVQLDACEELIHTTIQKSPQVIALVKSIIERRDLREWRDSLTDDAPLRELVPPD